MPVYKQTVMNLITGLASWKPELAACILLFSNRSEITFLIAKGAAEMKKPTTKNQWGSQESRRQSNSWS